jgi:hypothetical protein
MPSPNSPVYFSTGAYYARLSRQEQQMQQGNPKLQKILIPAIPLQPY